ncbi:CamS family sex pheromone protein [Aeribacillus composti]|uniref:CamS family sex pheromone protein n=1 Tax=Aeribacillus composti TaxID=1868734 RepID=UPI002E231473|nr:CamS family sex pheromone protein [Aeribacillus composti]MED0746204.1 CamS family sex pheromone protein [Aeribacillus composti]
MKKLLIIAAACMAVLSACSQDIGEPEQIVQETEESTEEKAIIPKYRISEDYYKMLVPFKTSEARGLVASNLNTRFDVDEFETGLMRMASDKFPTDKYVFQEGQYLDKKTVQNWLGRKLEGKDLEEAKRKDKSFKNEGLNPPESSEKSPIYVTHILEHNYLVKKDEKTLELGGVSIGLALNSVYYYRTEDGIQKENKIDKATIEKKGKEIAQVVVKRLRDIEGLEKVPIVVSLYEQAPKSSIVPGHFFARTIVDGGSENIGKWENINEEYYFFPSEEGTKKKPDDANTFKRLKGDIEDFFPNYTGIIGKAFYQDGEMKQMKIEVPVQFYGKTEVIAFTQFLTGKVVEYYKDYISLEVTINSSRGPEALIVREPGQEKPTVHVFQ